MVSDWHDIDRTDKKRRSGYVDENILKKQIEDTGRQNIMGFAWGDELYVIKHKKSNRKKIERPVSTRREQTRSSGTRKKKGEDFDPP